MAKRYIRLDIEFDDMEELENRTLPGYIVINNLIHLIREDMPYCKVIHNTSSNTRDGLDRRTVNSNISSLTPRK